jgi:hypothetical protein
MQDPYYQDDHSTIYHGDCRAVLPGFPDQSADLVFADPRYNVGPTYGSNTDDKRDPAVYRDWCAEWFVEARRVGSAVAITPGMVSVPMWIADIEHTHFLIAWTKANNNSRNYIGPTSGYQCWEPVLVYGKCKGTVLRDWIERRRAPAANGPSVEAWAAGPDCSGSRHQKR